MRYIYEQIWELASPFYEKGRTFDIPHIIWMTEKANEISKIEKVQVELLLPIIILHDVGYSLLDVNNININNKSLKKKHMIVGARISDEILSTVNYNKKLQDKIVYYISVHDNWMFGDDSPYKECYEMAIFNDLDYLYAISDPNIFTIIGRTLQKSAKETYKWWLYNEKLQRRPFCCEITKQMFIKYMSERLMEIN